MAGAKRQQKEAVRKQVLDGLRGGELSQIRPNTVVLIHTEIDGETYQAHGFAKVCWRDQWDPQTGFEMAVQKAIAKIVKAVMAGERLIEGPEWVSQDRVRALFAPATVQ